MKMRGILCKEKNFTPVGRVRMEKNLRLSPLFDCYGGLLSEKKQRVFSLYYDEDLSLAEISELTDITRQGVRDLLARTAEELLRYEEILGIYRKGRLRAESVRQIEGILAENEDMQRRVSALLYDIL